MAANASNKPLTLQDQLVLENIFNPNLPFDALSSPELSGEPDDLADGGDASSSHVVANNQEEVGKFVYCGPHGKRKWIHERVYRVDEWKRLESEAIRLAEAEDFDAALVLFDKAVLLQPDNASSYNNRAQLLRLKGNIEGAKKDLDVAIDKSGGIGAPACQAFTQRAMIRRLQGDDDAARADFKQAADLGSKFAKQQLVALNPYAALCNQMLSQMMSKASRGEPTNSGHPAG